MATNHLDKAGREHCPICEHRQRAAIENALMNISSDAGSIKLQDICESFNLRSEDLKRHALLHAPVTLTEFDIEPDKAQYTSALDSATSDELDGSDSSATTGPKKSIAHELKVREADMLMAVAVEYMGTLRNVGKRINGIANGSPHDTDEDNELKFAKLINKAVTDLYLGLGGEIRQTLKTVADLDQLINGRDSTANSPGGLQSLSVAIGKAASRHRDEETG